VRWTRNKRGEKQLWYNDGEIEEIMWSELSLASLLPDASKPEVDIESFVECHLRAEFDRTAVLPADVLGETEFVWNGNPIIRINRDLTGSALDDEQCPLGTLGRWRATVAHEASHAILHKILFSEKPGQQATFAFSVQEETKTEFPRVFRSLKRDVSFSCSGQFDWREVQANKGMAALLMPKKLFLELFDALVAEAALLPSQLTAGSSETPALAGTLAERFKVSKQAATIRIETLGALGRHVQPRLLF